MFEEIESSHFFLSESDFDFRLKKVDKFSTDEENYKLFTQMQRVESKYHYAKKVSDKKDRYYEMSRILEILLSNNYFNSEIRYNLAIIFSKLENDNKAIQILEELQDYRDNLDNFLFLIYLLHNNNRSIDAAHLFINNFKDKKMNRSQGVYLIKLISETKAYVLLEKLVNNFSKRYSPFSDEELFQITLFLGRNEHFVFNDLVKNLDLYTVSSDIKKNVEIIVKCTPTDILDKTELFKLKKKSENILVANAEIIQYWENSEQGNLMYFDNSQRKFLASFNLSDILEKKIRNKLNELKITNGQIEKPIPVFCFIENNPRAGAVKRAKGIQHAKSVDLTLALVNNLIRKKEYDVSRGILTEILIQFNEEYRCQELLNDLPPPIIDIPFVKKSKRRENTKYYYKAHTARQNQKWTEAKRLFAKAIELDQNKESAVKDLAAIYQREGDIDKAIELVEKYSDEMQNMEALYNFLSHLYFTNGNYSKTIEILGKVLAIKPSKKTNLNKRNIESQFTLKKTYFIRQGN